MLVALKVKTKFNNIKKIKTSITGITNCLSDSITILEVYFKNSKIRESYTTTINFLKTKFLNTLGLSFV